MRPKYQEKILKIGNIYTRAGIDERGVPYKYITNSSGQTITFTSYDHAKNYILINDVKNVKRILMTNINRYIIELVD